MKKILYIIVCLIMPGVADATTMCVHQYSYVATLSASRDGIDSEMGPDGKFTVTFDYDTASHEPTTNDEPATSSVGYKKINGLVSCNEVFGTFGVADAGVSASVYDTGQNCWCGMEYPVVSDWVYNTTYDTDSDCASNCMSACINAIMTNSTFRSGMFQSIW